MAVNIINPSTGQTGYQVPGGALPAGWQWVGGSAPATSATPTSVVPSSTASSSTSSTGTAGVGGGLPANISANGINGLRNQIIAGQITPQGAFEQVTANMSAYDKQQATPAIQQALWGNLGPISIGGGQQGTVNSDGSVVRSTTVLNQSTTTGAGTSSSTAALGSSNANIYNPATGQTGYQIPGQTPPSGWQPIPAGGVPGSTTGGSTTGTSGLSSTGDAGLDSIQDNIAGLANGLINSGYTIPPGLQITPALTKQFLAWAHQAVDPQTQQLISSKLDDINSNLQNQEIQFQASAGQAVQDFGTNLSSEQNTAGANGTAFSGQRNVNENNLVNSTNRSIQSLTSTAANNIGGILRSGASDVGGANLGGIIVPTLDEPTVSNLGGQLGSSRTFQSLGAGSSAYGYNPSNYTVGNIPTQQNTAVNNLAANYLSQYTTLAGNNSSRSISDIIGGITGLPAGYSVPSTLQ